MDDYFCLPQCDAQLPPLAGARVRLVISAPAKRGKRKNGLSMISWLLKICKNFEHSALEKGGERRGEKRRGRELTSSCKLVAVNVHSSSMIASSLSLVTSCLISLHSRFLVFSFPHFLLFTHLLVFLFSSILYSLFSILYFLILSNKYPPTGGPRPQLGPSPA